MKVKHLISILCILSLTACTNNSGISSDSNVTKPSSGISSSDSSNSNSSSSDSGETITDKVYFNQSFVDCQKAPSGWTYKSITDLYNDKTLKLHKEGAYVQSPAISDNIKAININVTFKKNGIVDSGALEFGVQAYSSSNELIVESMIDRAESISSTDSTKVFTLTGDEYISYIRIVYKTKLSGLNISLSSTKIYTGKADASDSKGDDTTTDKLSNYKKGIDQYKTDEGYYNVDFTKAEYATDKSQLGEYLDGCPTTGNVNVLVLPVEFSDLKESDTEALKKLDQIMNGGDSYQTAYLSAKDFYYESSYGQLNLNFDILGGGTKWYQPSKTSTYYSNKRDKEEDGSDATADLNLIEEILTANEKDIDFSKYDSDNNGYIDAVVVVTPYEIDYDHLLHWAFRYWSNSDAQFGGKYLDDYLWMPYDFLTYDSGDSDTITSNTLIHEFGHILGSDDLYDYGSSEDGPVYGNDIMDVLNGDHNPYTKFNYGWIKNSTLITSDSEVTLDIGSFEAESDSVIIANDFDESLGCYQEYWVMMYYTKNSINELSQYEFDEGLVMYHINGTLEEENYDGQIYYFNAYNNTSSGTYATSENLVELVSLSSEGFSLGLNQKSKTNLKDDHNRTIPYSISVSSMDGSNCTVTFTKI